MGTDGSLYFPAIRFSFRYQKTGNNPMSDFCLDVELQKTGNELCPVSLLEIGNPKTENESLSDYLLCVY